MLIKFNCFNLHIPQLNILLRKKLFYNDIFPETFKLMNIILTIPIGTASVERSFSQMKMIKTRLRNRLSHGSLAQLMRIAIEGPDPTLVNFEEILEIFKESNHRIQL